MWKLFRLNNLDEMYKLGLTVSDYSASDCNREMIMVAAQQSVDIKDLLVKEKEKSRALMRTFNQIDESKKRAEDLLSTMMPPEVARELLEHGRADKLSICDSFESVTLAFAKVCNFNEITAHLSPLDVVNLLNSIYSNFDSVIKKHGTYKSLLRQFSRQV
uniref:guanylate cyclase n=1 Tax=Romanomermis culicivorax TaxID=13658 RepID=A0A915K231_ROMCU